MISGWYCEDSRILICLSDSERIIYLSSQILDVGYVVHMKVKRISHFLRIGVLEKGAPDSFTCDQSSINNSRNNSSVSTRVYGPEVWGKGSFTHDW